MLRTTSAADGLAFCVFVATLQALVAMGFCTVPRPDERLCARGGVLA